MFSVAPLSAYKISNCEIHRLLGNLPNMSGYALSKKIFEMICYHIKMFKYVEYNDCCDAELGF